MKAQFLSAMALLGSASVPAHADVVPAPAQPTASASGFESPLTASEREAYRAVFYDIRVQNWVSAQSRLAAMPEGLLHPVARAEIYLAPASTRVEGEPLAALLASAPELPDAEQIAGLAVARGATSAVGLPYAQTLYRFSGPSHRLRAQPIGDDATARSLARDIQRLIQQDSPSAAEQLIAGREAELSAAGLTELRQRIAWSYYLTGDDGNARRVARQARPGGGEWAVQAAWVEGLAAWRQRDCAAAAEAFGSVGSAAGDSETMAAGLYWAARAEMACGRANSVQPLLRTASRLTETFYGMLAGRQLGLPNQPLVAIDALAAHRDALVARPNIRRAVALHELGESALAEEMLRHEARIGEARNHGALIELAGRLNLPATQLWLSQNGPSSYSPGATARYPAPAWRPVSGWRVDRSLVYAHALQESNFRPDAVSHAGARGLMQLMPGTAQIIARRRGEAIDAGRLNVPEVNIEYGQAYLEEMRDFGGTQGLLPKVIASYNAGPGSVLNWEGRLRDRGDPLLYIESIPFIETRHYVPIVLRNYWMYQRNAGERATSLEALAQGMWPRFPGMPGATAVRLTGAGTRVAD